MTSVKYYIKMVRYTFASSIMISFTVGCDNPWGGCQVNVIAYLTKLREEVELIRLRSPIPEPRARLLNRIMGPNKFERPVKRF